MGKPFLSRHFLGEQADCIAALPFAAPGAAEGGVATAHNLLALGTWSEDAQVRRAAIAMADASPSPRRRRHRRRLLVRRRLLLAPSTAPAWPCRSRA